MSEQQLNECPICMDNIEDMCNKVITECGHIFHCSCLMKNVNHNGFKCPCCRSKMADESDGDSDDESDGESDEERIEFGENVLTSFRIIRATPSSPRFGTNFNELVLVIMDEAERDEL